MNENIVLKKEPIAIVGIGCRLPGNVYSPDDFWNLLINKVDALEDIPASRFNIKAFYDPDIRKRGTINCLQGGFLSQDPADFDARFFGIPPVEAMRMDIQQRILLEVSIEALEDSGLRLEDIDGTNMGVYIAISASDYGELQSTSSERANINGQTNSSVAFSIASNRLSYLFNINGPSLSLDTACSSSLTCVHLACRSIWMGEAGSAIVGGVMVHLKPESYMGFTNGGFLSKDSRCKAFDSSANGFTRSEGCIAIVLKPLSKAIEDKDNIYATIVGSAINQDGKTIGISVPNGAAQADLLVSAYKNAGISPSQIAYVEAHGTGTPVGDPIEVNSLGSIMSQGRKDGNTLIIGSAKTNIGHAEPVSGLVGLTKMALSMKHRQIPPNIHFNNPNPNIPFDKYKMKVPVDVTPWPEYDKEILGGVNSFGFGGSNAHAVFKGYTNTAEKARPESEVAGVPYLFSISAKDKGTLKKLAESYITYCGETKNSLTDICYSVHARRSSFDHRLSLIAYSKDEIAKQLQEFVDDVANERVKYRRVSSEKEFKVAFICSGQGSQWWAMGRELLEKNSLFRETILSIDKILSNYADWSLMDEMSKSEGESRIDETNIAQPAIFALQVGLANIWKSFGVNPKAVVGHSVGEVAAAYLSGALNLEEAVKLIYYRSSVQAKATGKGKMLAVGLSRIVLEEEIKEFGHKVSIATVNSPTLVALAGDTDLIMQLKERFTERGIYNQLLKIEVPFHSYHMEPLKDELLEKLASLKPQTTQIDYYSTVTGDILTGESLNNNYWYKNVREAVEFEKTINKLIEDGINLFIEIGPHPIHSSAVIEMLQAKGKEEKVIHSLRRNEKDNETLFSQLGALHTIGFSVAWQKVFDTSCSYVALPPYPWTRERFWNETIDLLDTRMKEPIHPLIKGYQKSITNPDGYSSWDIVLDTRLNPYIRDHVVQGALIFPGTGQLEIAYAAGKENYGDRFVFLEDVNLLSPLFLPEDGEPPYVKLEVDSYEGKYKIYSKSRKLADAQWTAHSNGKINFLRDTFKPSVDPEIENFSLEAIKKAVTITSDNIKVRFYEKYLEQGLFYGPTFQNLENLWVSDARSLALIEVNKDLRFEYSKYNFHPAIFDCCLQSVTGTLITDPIDHGVYLPVHFERIKILATPGEKIWCYCKMTSIDKVYYRGNIWVFNDDGELAVEIQGYMGKYLEGSSKKVTDQVKSFFYEPEWVEVGLQQEVEQPSHAASAKNTWMLFADNKGVSEKLNKMLVKAGQQCIVVTNGEQFFASEGQIQINPLRQEDFDQLFKLNDPENLAGIIHLWSLDAKNPVEGDITNLENAQKTGTSAILNMVRSLVQFEYLDKIPLWIVTNGTQLIDLNNDIDLSISQSSIRGIGRVIMNEYIAATVKSIDLSANIPDVEVELLFNELFATSQDAEIAFRNGKKYAMKLDVVSESKIESTATKTVSAAGYPFNLKITDFGNFENLKYQEVLRRKPANDEVEIKVCSTGMNFRDIMMSMGLLSEKAVEGGYFGRTLGLECSGVVISVGDLVTDYKPGDEVIAIAPESFSGFVYTKDYCVVPKPKHINFEDGASILTVYATAYYGLHYLCNISKGDRVLIHAAAGGVGIAAVKLAILAGAEVYATAGRDEKHEYLKSLGVKNIFNSRNLNYADEIMEATKGEGVDIILNSLAGDNIPQSIRCLAPFGRFVEIGKADIYQNRRIDLERFGNNLAYFALDVDRMAIQRPKLIKKVLGEVMELFSSKKISTHPVHAFPASKVKEAFKFMSQANHIGKVVVNMNDEIPVLPSETLQFDENATYLVTGGNSGFGLAVARWMSKKGAKTIVLVSRSGPKSDEDKQIIDEMLNKGVRVEIMKTDITNQDDVYRLFSELKNFYPPVKGIMHAAAVLDDSVLTEITHDRLMKVMRPKVNGAWNLHNASKDLKLDHFVLFSSIAAVMGSAGQGNYVAANTFFDVFAYYRRAKGLTCTTINWGPIGETGMVARDKKVTQMLEAQGLINLSLHQTMTAMEMILLQNAVQRIAINFDWSKLKESVVGFSPSSLIAKLIVKMSSSDNMQSSNKQIKDILAELNDEEKLKVVREQLRNAVAKIMGMEAEKLDVEVSIAQMGLDSLMATQIRNVIKSVLGVDYSIMNIMKGLSVVEISNELVKLVNENIEKTKNVAVEEVEYEQGEILV
ncbi:MAG: type I polyketide synthase [Bacteroidales bacterium]|nr:type I polyketide synthase [Bacteroidales bacterium]